MSSGSAESTRPQLLRICKLRTKKYLDILVYRAAHSVDASPTCKCTQRARNQVCCQTYVTLRVEWICNLAVACVHGDTYMKSWIAAFSAALFRHNQFFNQQLNSSEWPIYCDHSVTSADVRLASALVVNVNDILLQISVVNADTESNSLTCPSKQLGSVSRAVGPGRMTHAHERIRRPCVAAGL